MVYPEGTDEAISSSQIYFVTAGVGHSDRTENLLGQFALPVAVSLRCRRTDVARTFKRITTAVVVRAKKEGLSLEPFTVHDLRRTGSTLLNELGFNSDWIEKCWPMKTAARRGASTTKRNTSTSADT